MEEYLGKATIIIAIVGPESSGKTALASELGKRLHAPVVPEYAREYLTVRGGSYAKEDLDHIAKGQFDAEQRLLQEEHPVVICDTDLSVIKIWSDTKYGNTSAGITALLAGQPERFLLLMQPDLPWEPDPLRENPNDRDELFDRYVEFLDETGASYAVVGGEGEKRLKNAMDAIERLTPITPRTASGDDRGAYK
jgi:NadR type nicotinamide-nucleotide adenylyltransferase